MSKDNLISSGGSPGRKLKLNESMDSKEDGPVIDLRSPEKPENEDGDGVEGGGEVEAGVCGRGDEDVSEGTSDV